MYFLFLFDGFKFAISGLGDGTRLAGRIALEILELASGSEGITPWR
jgi:hypothetical protein